MRGVAARRQRSAMIRLASFLDLGVYGVRIACRDSRPPVSPRARSTSHRRSCNSRSGGRQVQLNLATSVPGTSVSAWLADRRTGATPLAGDHQRQLRRRAHRAGAALYRRHVNPGGQHPRPRTGIASVAVPVVMSNSLPPQAKLGTDVSCGSSPTTTTAIPDGEPERGSGGDRHRGPDPSQPISARRWTSRPAPLMNLPLVKVKGCRRSSSAATLAACGFTGAEIAKRTVKTVETTNMVVRCPQPVSAVTRSDRRFDCRSRPVAARVSHHGVQRR